MNETPTSGPISASITHHAREVSRSRHSFSSSQRKAVLCKGKEHFLEVRLAAPGELLDGPFAADAAAAEEHEAIADPRRVADLMNGEEERAAGRRVGAERGADVARLAQI